ncbi:hypothetical protein Nepgr_027289 [Nepenthes gracilis]|uniref:Uncharacterized protein n=1 Tax=Nepenthes gracilis TaxID=150966 RepID=A0AAD3TB46_NEPGR|nr:hypothetical protein Nepgr_027289 [Nepenthes gracilis]
MRGGFAREEGSVRLVDGGRQRPYVTVATSNGGWSKVATSPDLGKEALQESCSVRDESSVDGVPGDSCEVAFDVNCEPLAEVDVHSPVENADLGLTPIPLPSPDFDSGISHGLRAVEAVALDGHVAEDRARLLNAVPADPPGSSSSLMRPDCAVVGLVLTIPGLGECGVDLEEQCSFLYS